MSLSKELITNIFKNTITKILSIPEAIYKINCILSNDTVDILDNNTVMYAITFEWAHYVDALAIHTEILTTLSFGGINSDGDIIKRERIILHNINSPAEQLNNTFSNIIESYLNHKEVLFLPIEPVKGFGITYYAGDSLRGMYTNTSKYLALTGDLPTEITEMLS